MAKLNDDQRRALKTLARPDGCAEAMLLADGFSIDQLAGLVIEGYAVMPGADRDVVGILRGAVSGQLMVSDQAARSIG